MTTEPTVERSTPLYFNRYLASLAVQGEPEFVDFLAQVRPQVLQRGFYGPQVYALGEAPEGAKQQAGGYPMSMPVRGIREAPDGSIHMGDRWGYPRTAGCSNNPHWRELHKRMVRIAVEMCDVDGFMSWYNYDYGCACPYCNAAFRAYLAERYGPAELEARFAIDDLECFCLAGSPSKERRLPVEDIAVDLRLPSEARADGVDFLSPDEEARGAGESPETSLEFTQSEARVGFRIPRMLVYGVAVVRLVH